MGFGPASLVGGYSRGNSNRNYSQELRVGWKRQALCDSRLNGVEMAKLCHDKQNGVYNNLRNLILYLAFRLRCMATSSNITYIEE